MPENNTRQGWIFFSDSNLSLSQMPESLLIVQWHLSQPLTITNTVRFNHELYSQITTLQLNESACKRPLVETDHPSSWYEGIEGCGIQCENPIFTSEEHTRIHRFVGAFGSLSFTCSLFTMVCLRIYSKPCIKLVPRVSLLPVPWWRKKRDPGNELVHIMYMYGNDQLLWTLQASN